MEGLNISERLLLFIVKDNCNWFKKVFYNQSKKKKPSEKFNGPFPPSSTIFQEELIYNLISI